jgi:homospermidine synthase
MDKGKIIIIGAGSDNPALKKALEEHLKHGEEVIFIDSHKDFKMHEIGTTVRSEDIIKAIESIPRENKPRTLSEIIKEDLAKPFVITNYREEQQEVKFYPGNNHGPIGAILGNKKRKRK